MLKRGYSRTLTILDSQKACYAGCAQLNIAQEGKSVRVNRSVGCVIMISDPLRGPQKMPASLR